MYEIKELESIFLTEQKQITKRNEWICFYRAFRCIKNAISSLPFDPKFNSIIWAYDVFGLINEIIYSFCWMKTYAILYKEKYPKGSRLQDVDFHVSYFADNAITRIYSCRDKVALMVWAYFIPFNPEKTVPKYEEILQKLQNPLKYDLKLMNIEVFYKALENLDGNNFDMVEKYRHMKIHRREPRIEIYGVKPHHDWDYIIPLIDQNEKKRFEKDLIKKFPDPTFRDDIYKSCVIDGVLYDYSRRKDRLWDYQVVHDAIKECLFKLLLSSDKCFRSLRKRKPLRK